MHTDHFFGHFKLKKNTEHFWIWFFTIHLNFFWDFDFEDTFRYLWIEFKLFFPLNWTYAGLGLWSYFFRKWWKLAYWEAFGRKLQIMHQLKYMHNYSKYAFTLNRNVTKPNLKFMIFIGILHILYDFNLWNWKDGGMDRIKKKEYNFNSKYL